MGCSFVDGLCIGAEEGSELLADESFEGTGFLKGTRFLQSFDSNHKMEVIWQQTIGVCLCDWSYIFRVKFQEIVVVALFEKDILSIITTIVDVINYSWNERNLVHFIEK